MKKQAENQKNEVKKMEHINYEAVLVMDPALDETAQKSFFQKVREVIRSFKGQIHHIDSWGRRKLANKNRKKWAEGLYFHWTFNGTKGVIEELTRQIQMDEKTLYYHFEKLKKSPEEHLADFRYLIKEAIRKEQERQERLQKRKGLLSSVTGPVKKVAPV